MSDWETHDYTMHPLSTDSRGNSEIYSMTWDGIGAERLQLLVRSTSNFIKIRYALTSNFFFPIFAVLHSVPPTRVNRVVCDVIFDVNCGKDLNNSSSSTTTTETGMVLTVTAVTSNGPQISLLTYDYLKLETRSFTCACVQSINQSIVYLPT